jgi:hypothetical protein
MKYFILVLLIAITIAFYRVFLKLITIDSFFALAIQWIFMFILGIIFYLLSWKANLIETLSSVDFRNLVFIFLAGFVLILNWALIMTGLRMWFDISKFTVAYAIMWNVVIIIIGYLFFKDKIRNIRE